MVEEEEEVEVEVEVEVEMVSDMEAVELVGEDT